MMFDLITIILVGMVVLFAVYTATQLLGKFPRRTLDDVTPYLRPAELEEIQELLDPAQEVNFRLRLSPEEFRRWQRKRIHLMREYLLRMSHNALVLIEWGNLECFEGGSGSRVSPERQAMAQELVQAATEFRLYSLLALFKLKIWIIFRLDRWPLVSAPSLPALRRVFGIDALSSYNRVKQAAGGLSTAYGRNEFMDLL